VRLGRPCVVGAVQVAPTPRIRLREVQRCGGGEAHGASNSRPSNLKLALIAYWYGLALCAESSRHIWHIRIVNARPGARTLLRSTGRPLKAYSRRLVSLQATCSLCHAYGMHASRWQQQACVWNAASGGRCVRHHGYRCDLIEIHSPEWLPLAACSNAPDVSCISADHRATGRPWATAVALASHTSRGSSSLRHRCAVCTAGLGNGHALRSCG
jgi:hypothetical protein